ncbi:MAG: ROK family protein [Bacteroidales bacterium]|nr:ROK family protein [Bacteroidales bacterium]
MYDSDSRIVLTLDAGGTNFVFSAIQGNKEIVTPLTLASNTDNLDKCLKAIVSGFEQVKQQLSEPPVAISFAFPGPADYEHGIIGDLPNFPSFRGGVALGPFLHEKFGIPIYINNDGHLFAYGEALAGALPQLNKELSTTGSQKRYRNLLGVTLGTGFGGGVVIDNVLLLGDNFCGGSVWLSANKLNNDLLAETNVSIRSVKQKYNELAGIDADLTPKDIFDIAEGMLEGNREAAIKSFEELGKVAGFTIAEALNIIDGIVVIGGGISKAYKYFLPSMLTEMNGYRKTINGDVFPRLQMKPYNLMDENEKAQFLLEETNDVVIYGTTNFVKYNVAKKTGVLISSLGTSKAISLGAYNFALNQLDK